MRVPVLIVVISMCLFSCIDKHPKADMVIFNGIIYTLNDKEPKAEAVAVDDGRIVYVGNNLNANNWVGDSTVILDLDGKTIIPGFIDGHAHLMGLGYRLLDLNLSSASSYEAIIDSVGSAVRRSEKGEWIVGKGWHQDKWDVNPTQMVSGFPVNDSLSKISPENPVILYHSSAHLVLVNDLALKLAGIDHETSNPEGGEIIRTQDKKLTGILNESAAKLVLDIIPEPSDERQIEALHMAIQQCLRNGVTAIHDAGIGQRSIDLYESFLSNEMLGIKIYAMLDGSDEPLLKAWFEKGPRLDEDFLVVRCIKLYADGALGSRGALLLEDYADAPGQHGMKVTPSDHILRVVEEAYERGFQVATHCIGDKANQETLDLYKIVLESDTTKENPRFRIEHAQHLSAEDIPRFAELGVIPSMQAIHMASDRPWAIHRLGEKRIQEGAYVWRKLIDNGATIMNGTDAPVEPINPIANFYASITRKTLLGKPEGGYEPDQRMTRLEALSSLTTNNAYGAFQEGIKGKIETGKVADFTVLSRNIMSIPEDEILETEVIYTIINGEIKFEK